MESVEEKPKLVAFDLDGTLAESKQPLLPAMGALLARLMEKMPVAVMSGGSFIQFQKQFLSGLPESAPLERLYLFPTNAASACTFRDGSWQNLYQNELSKEEKQKIFDALDAVLVETGMHEVPSQVWGERIEDRGSQISFSPLGQEAPVDAKEAWNRSYDDRRRAARQKLAERLPECSVSAGGLTTIDITHKGINKAYGVRQLADLSGIPISDMLYVGDALWDGGNDSVVKQTGVPTLQVADPKETAKAIESILALR